MTMAFNQVVFYKGALISDPHRVIPSGLDKIYNPAKDSSPAPQV